MSGKSFPSVLEDLIEEFSRLPGVGRKSATRLAFYILNLPNEEAYDFANAIINVKRKIKFCTNCYNLSEEDLCGICKDLSRNHKQICVVEDPVSLLLIERTKEYQGLYHVIGGVISPLDGIGADDLHIKDLLERLKDVDEVIIALNPSTEGEATSLYLSRIIKPLGIKITRLASGIPLGSQLEFIDELTLSKALKTRMEI
jgi:recombination protein RecR